MSPQDPLSQDYSTHIPHRSVRRIDYTEYVVLLEEHICCLDCRDQYAILSGKVDTSVPDRIEFRGISQSIDDAARLFVSVSILYYMTKTLASGSYWFVLMSCGYLYSEIRLLKIESALIYMYFKNNRIMHHDYLNVTKEHVTTLQELLDQGRELKLLDEHIGHAFKFAAKNKELLVYVTASCPFTQSENEKWAPATCHRKNNKPYVDAYRTKQTIETITKEHAVNQNTQKTDNTMLPSTGRVSSTNSSRSKPKSNTKNDRIPQPSSRSKKNKVESHHRKFKSSANKNNHVLDCNVNVKNVALLKNSDTNCLSCNECLFSANHDACVV
nr:hypothetical protein [Tanacetum cinerariifolium]